MVWDCFSWNGVEAHSRINDTMDKYEYITKTCYCYGSFGKTMFRSTAREIIARLRNNHLNV